MAGRKKKVVRKRGRGGKIALAILGALVLCLGFILAYAAFNANTLHVRHAEVYLPDLPQSFDGKTILFASDIDLCGLNTPEKSATLFSRLQALQPDILLLGGDYTSSSLMDILNRASVSELDATQQLRDRTAFFQQIADFEAPLGKFAIAGDNDVNVESLSQIMQASGVVPLFNNRVEIQCDNASIWIVGFCADTSGVDFTAVGNAFQQQDCVIAFAHSPGVFPQLLTAEASDSGRWLDLALAGHTHGGQIRLFDRNVIRLSDQEQHYLAGWTMEGGLPMLTTTGIGCEGANLRLGSEAEVWMITLRKKASSVLLPDLT